MIQREIDVVRNQLARNHVADAARRRALRRPAHRRRDGAAARSARVTADKIVIARRHAPEPADDGRVRRRHGARLRRHPEAAARAARAGRRRRRRDRHRVRLDVRGARHQGDRRSSSATACSTSATTRSPRRCSTTCATSASPSASARRWSASSATTAARSRCSRAASGSPADAVLYSAGRSGATEALDARERRPRGRRPRGRIVGRRALPHRRPAHLRGRRRDRLPEPRRDLDGAGPAGRLPRVRHRRRRRSATTLPIGIYTIPEISFVGQDRGGADGRVDPVRDRHLAATASWPAARSSATTTGMLKLLVARGRPQASSASTCSAPDATELVHIGQAVMALGGTVDFLVETVFNYPTLAESYKVAALDATNKLRAIPHGAPRQSPPRSGRRAHAPPPPCCDELVRDTRSRCARSRRRRSRSSSARPQSRRAG